MINRRVFATLLGALPTLGKTAMPQAGLVSTGAMAAVIDREVGRERGTVDPAASNWYQDRISELLNPEHVEQRYSDYLFKRHLGYNVGEALDPDLREMKSFSATAKARIQRDRDFIKELNGERFDIMKDIKRQQR